MMPSDGDREIEWLSLSLRYGGNLMNPWSRNPALDFDYLLLYNENPLFNIKHFTGCFSLMTFLLHNED
jgi:hypothetical protein